MSDRTAMQALDRWVEALDGLGFADPAVGERSRRTTSQVASQIACYYMAAGRRVFQEAVFPVGFNGTQGAARGDDPGAVRPDVSFQTRDRWRANLEVDDRPERSRSHLANHQTVLQQLLDERGASWARCLIERTQSIFLLVNDARQVTHIQRVRYRVTNAGRTVSAIVAATDADGGRLERPLAVAQVLRSGLLDRFEPAMSAPPACPAGR